MTEKEKIKQYLEFKRIRKSNFYLETGLSNGFLERGKSVGADKIKIIISKYPDLNLNWLILDKGNMIKPKSENSVTVKNSNIFQKNENQNECYHSGEDEGVNLLKKSGTDQCYGCLYRDEIIKALNIALEAKNGEITAKQNEINAIYEILEDKKRTIRRLTEEQGNINKQTG